MKRPAWLVVAFGLVAAGCSITTTTDQVTPLDTPATAVVIEPTTPPVTAGATAEREPTPAPTANPSPRSSPIPTPTLAPEVADVPDDDSPIVVQGDGWAITQNEYDELVALVEETHQLNFTDPVGVVISDDIGVEFARGFEPFSEADWLLMRGLGMASSEDERRQANQLRLDRIRGFCCSASSEGQAVVVELQDSEFATALIVVHELVHAVHSQNPELAPRRIATNETPFPAAAAFEGVPQFVTFDFMRLGSEADRTAVEPDLPIIPDDMLDQIVDGAARHLNFAYATGPAFVEAVVAKRGLDGLSELMISPPETTEQVLFPQKYLDGEVAERVAAPDVPPAASVMSQGTIGSAMLLFLLQEQHEVDAAREMVEPWAGDAYVVYTRDEALCMAAAIAVDSEDQAAPFADQLASALAAASPDGQIEAASVGRVVTLTACHP